ncbi:MAG TPA: hypothetical protein VEA63_02280 [Opitutus sp.]|nr:hypothetical protein [Opitutus sp.]
MKNLVIRSPLCALVGALFIALPCLRAHSVWLEDTPDQQLVLRFGEPGDDYEKSPGHLDSLTLPSAWTLKSDDDGKPAAFTVEKKSDHFLFASADPSIAAFGETRFPVRKRGNRPASWPHFYVRWQPAGAPTAATLSPTLTLDIVPTLTPGEFRVHFRGQPIAGATVTARHFGTHAEEKLTADDRGIIRFTTTDPGLVLLTANHKEPLAGFSGGVAYDVTSHNTALTWRQP